MQTKEPEVAGTEEEATKTAPQPEAAVAPTAEVSALPPAAAPVVEEKREIAAAETKEAEVERPTAAVAPLEFSPAIQPVLLDRLPPALVEEVKTTPVPDEVAATKEAEAVEAKKEAPLPPRPAPSWATPFRVPSSSLSSLSSPSPCETGTPPARKRKSEWSLLTASPGGAGSVADESEAVAQALTGSVRPRRGSLEGKGKEKEKEDLPAPPAKRQRQRRTSVDSAASVSPSPASSPEQRAAPAPALELLTPLPKLAAPVEEAKQPPPAQPMQAPAMVEEGKAETSPAPEAKEWEDEPVPKRKRITFSQPSGLSHIPSSTPSPPNPPLARIPQPHAAASEAAEGETKQPLPESIPEQGSALGMPIPASSFLSPVRPARKRQRLNEVDRLMKSPGGTPVVELMEQTSMTRRSSVEPNKPEMARRQSLEAKTQREKEEEVEVDIMGTEKGKGRGKHVRRSSQGSV